MPRPPPCPGGCPHGPPQPAAFPAPPDTWLAWRCPSGPMHLFCPRAPPTHIQEQRSSKPAFARCPPPPPPPRRQGREPICPVGCCTRTRYPPKKGAGECAASTLSTPASPACTPFPPRSSALQSPPACLWRPSLSRPAPLGAPLGSHPVGPGFSGHASPRAFRTSAPGPTFQTQRFKEKQTPCTQLARRGENISFSKPPAHRTPLVPSGDHRCSATVEICLPEAGTGEYFWPN